jgi:hypothetical protein
VPAASVEPIDDDDVADGRRRRTCRRIPARAAGVQSWQRSVVPSVSETMLETSTLGYDAADDPSV